MKAHECHRYDKGFPYLTIFSLFLCQYVFAQVNNLPKLVSFLAVFVQSLIDLRLS